MIFRCPLLIEIKVGSFKEVEENLIKERVRTGSL
jgi:hypothetical protein